MYELSGFSKSESHFSLKFYQSETPTLTVNPNSFFIRSLISIPVFIKSSPGFRYSVKSKKHSSIENLSTFSVYSKIIYIIY